MLRSRPVDWLLEADNPSVRYFTLVDLLDMPYGDPQVIQARQSILDSDPVVKILGKQSPESCWGRHTCFIGVVKAMKALAEIPPEMRSLQVQDTLQKGCEYLLQHHIFKRSQDLTQVSKPEWLRFGFPLMWNTDLLEISGILTGLGCCDPRMQEAIDLILSKQDSQGCGSRVLWNWMSLAQHHGLPTWLLDWTISPLVAAHFATDTIESFDRDGVIWMVNQRKDQQYLPEQLRSQLQNSRADYFTAAMLSETIPTFEALDALAPPNFVIFFEPPSMDERIVNQYALFSVIPDPTAVLDDWLSEHPDLWTKIILPAELKWEVRDKLDQANVTERVLFPGLDGLSRWQKRYYSPRE